jgi:glucan phosphoethanolaminetransferase (alkaline phosphatase superfamily)
MNKGFWYSVFRPVQNRNYIGLKKYRILFLVRLLPVFVLILIGVILQPSGAWLSIIGLVILVMLINYFFLAATEKASWNILFKKHYNDQSEPADYELMKTYEQNPTPGNLAKIQELKDK